MRPWRPARLSASSWLTRSTVVKKRPRDPARMQLRATAMARCVLPVPVPPTRTTLRGSISAEAARRNDCLEFSEVEVADRLQRLGGGTVLEVLWQGFQPGGIVTLQRGQLGDSVAPTLGATAVIKWSPCPDCRCPRGPSSTTACLALGIGHGSLADRLARHGPLRSVTSRNHGHRQRSGAVLEAPAFVAGLDDVAVVGQAVEQRGRHFWIAKDARPIAEGEVGGDDDRGALVEPADEMEQQLSSAKPLKETSMPPCDRSWTVRSYSRYPFVLPWRAFHASSAGPADAKGGQGDTGVEAGMDAQMHSFELAPVGEIPQRKIEGLGERERCSAVLRQCKSQDLPP